MATPIKIESFLTIERTMVNVIFRKWLRDGGAEAVRKIQGDAKRGEFDAARATASKLSFAGVQEQIGQLDRIGTAAVLLGESFFSGGTLGPLGRGEAQVDEFLLQTAIGAMAQELEFNDSRRLSEDSQAQVDAAEQQVDPVLRGGDVIEIQKAADLDLAAQLNSTVAKGAKRLVEVEANLTTSKLVSLGALSRADELGVQTFQINEVLDNLICPVCRRMHGRVFSVRSASDDLIAQLGAQNTQDRAAKPWPRQSRAGIRELTDLDQGQLVSRGWDKPPFHPGCRGVIVPVGSVPRDEFVPFTGLLEGVAVSEQMARSVADF